MTILVKPKVRLSEGDVEIVSIDYTNILDGSEKLTSVEINVISGGLGELIIDNESINSEEVFIRHNTVNIGKAVQFTISGQLEGVQYIIEVTVTTDSSPERTLVRRFWFKGC